MQRRPLRSRRHRSRKRGFTLLEIVLGMAIFFGSLAIFSQILWNGSRAAVQGQLRAQAMVRCEAKLGEVVAGAMPFQSQQNQAFSSEGMDQGWSWSVDIEPTNHPNLNAVAVTVSHAGNSPMSMVDVQLRRWMRDPAQMAMVAQAAAQQEAENQKKADDAKTKDDNEKAQAQKNPTAGGSNGKSASGSGSGNSTRPKRGLVGKGNGPDDGSGNPKGGGPNGGGGNPKGGGGPRGGGGPQGGGGNPKGGGGGQPGGGGTGLPPGIPPEILNQIPPGLIPPGGFPPGTFPPGLFPSGGGGSPKGK